MLAGRAIVVLLHCLQLCSCFLFSTASLYNSTDELSILDHTNFTTSLLGSENAWIIEFYNSWCGHCIQFAPTWKLFGKDIRDWQHTIKVGVIDCSVDENNGICREYEVMGYPTMRLFAARTKKGDVGKDTHSRNVEDLNTSVISFLVEQQKANNGSSSWINLLPYQGSLAKVWEEVPPSAEHVLVIIDSKESFVGRSVIMDLGGYSSVALKYKEASEDDAKKYGTTYPIVIYVDHSGKEEVEQNKLTTRKELTEMLMKKFNLHRSMLPYKTLFTGIKDDSAKREEMEGGGDGHPEEINSDKLNYEDDLPDTAYTGEKKDQVYMVDIENAVRYALAHEVVQHRVISGQSLKSLQEFLDILVKYLPMRPAVHNFLTRLHEYTLSQTESIHGETLAEKIKALQGTDSVLPEQQPWIGCRGSSPKYRGYPCGLWTTFHTITVNAVLQDGRNEKFNAKKPLRAIHGYVRDFFGCKYCSQHFQEMYKVDAESSVNVPDDGILWLWRGHNKVNKRLKGDPSEDPEHPKQQFPTRSFCPSCWNGDSMNEKEILTYLKAIYSKGALSLKGTQAILGPMMNRQAKVKGALEKHRSERLMMKSEEYKETLQPLNASWGFNTTDISLCVFLYGLSTVIILGVYCVVVIRRRMRRRKFIQMYKEPKSRPLYLGGQPLLPITDPFIKDKFI
ncbi:sulfhydryl oxidase 2-like isoform X2 [Macrobrachium nipponense]|uniref:sulfhydryl oxidase 2-like isoform X2 n=1 Tax=Macrobrachium nipponense TaxID=159736 RepID=UPI0030C875AD